jgi:hypothetical protein
MIKNRKTNEECGHRGTSTPVYKRIPPLIPPKQGWKPKYLLTRNKDTHESELKPIFVLSEPNNLRVTSLIGINKGTQQSCTAVIDTGAGTNVIRADALPKNWKSMATIVTDAPTRNIQSANGQTMKSLATVQLECSIGAYNFSERFLVVEELAIPVIFGYRFMKTHVMAINPTDERITFRHHVTAYAKSPQGTPNRNSESFIRVAQQVILPPMSETNALAE